MAGICGKSSDSNYMKHVLLEMQDDVGFLLRDSILVVEDGLLARCQ